MNTAQDVTWMAHALRMAQHGLYTTRPNPRVGCVIVKDNAIIGQGWHAVAGQAHAEVMALQQAGEQAQGATCYVTLAPCAHYGRTAPCTDALIAAGINRVVAATLDPNPLVAENSAQQLTAAGIEFSVGVLSQAAQALNPGFFQRMVHQRPYVRLKTATSLDGRTAMQSGESQWITGPAARAHVQALRAQSCVVLTGVATVLADDPALTVRDPQVLQQTGFAQPIRVVLDSQLRMPLSAKMLNGPGKTWIYTVSTDQAKINALKAKGAEVFQTAQHDTRVQLDAVLSHLAQQSVNEVLVEAGGELNGALMHAGLVDEWHVFMAPKIMGEHTRGLCTLPDVKALAQAKHMRVKKLEKVGQDYHWLLKPGGA